MASNSFFTLLPNNVSNRFHVLNMPTITTRPTPPLPPVSLENPLRMKQTITSSLWDPIEANVDVDRTKPMHEQVALLLKRPQWEQRTEEWTKKRQELYITAADFAAILGLNKYKSAHEVFLEKTHQVPPFQGNKFTERGVMFEPVAISTYEKFMNEPVESVGLLEHPTMVGVGAVRVFFSPCVMFFSCFLYTYNDHFVTHRTKPIQKMSKRILLTMKTEPGWYSAFDAASH